MTKGLDFSELLSIAEMKLDDARRMAERRTKIDAIRTRLGNAKFYIDLAIKSLAESK